MMSPNKAQILEEMKQLLSEREPRSKQRKDLINYYKQIKDDPVVTEELRKHDPHRWFMILQEAYSTCDSPCYEGRNIDREAEKLMVAIRERWTEEGHELFQPFIIDENAKFFEELVQKIYTTNNTFNIIALKRIYRLKHWVFPSFPIGIFAVILSVIPQPLARLFDINLSHSNTASNLFIMLFTAIALATLHFLFLFLNKNKSIFISKIFFNTEKIYQHQIDEFVELYCLLAEEKEVTIRRHYHNGHRSTTCSLGIFLKELMPENISVLLSWGQEQPFRSVISMGLENDLIKKISFAYNSALIHQLTYNQDNDPIVKSKLKETFPQLQPNQIEQITKELEPIKSDVVIPMYTRRSKHKELTGILSFGPKLYGRYTEADLLDLFWLAYGFSTALDRRELRLTRKFNTAIRGLIEEASNTSEGLKLESKPKTVEDLKKELLITEAERITKGGIEYEEARKNYSPKTWDIFDSEVHGKGISFSTKLLMKRDYDIDIAEGFRIDISSHSINPKAYMGAMAGELMAEMDEAELQKKLSQMQEEKDAHWMLHQTEWFDGTGFPDGMAGEDIPYRSRAVSVAEAFDIFYQCYKDVPKTLSVIKKFSGTKFDPLIVNALERACQKGTIEKITRRRS